MEMGNTWIYQSDSIVFNKQLNSVDTFTSQIREQIVNTFVDEESNLVYIIDRSFRIDDNQEWTSNASYTSYVAGSQVIRVEDNLRFVKCVLPVEEGAEWDGNQYINDLQLININGEQIEVYKNWDYEIISTTTKLMLNGVNYTEVLDIEQANSENALEKRYAKEYYVSDIGLVYKEMTIIDTQDGDISRPIEERAEKGFIHSLALIDHF